jgi:hypothetical protein
MGRHLVLAVREISCIEEGTRIVISAVAVRRSMDRSGYDSRPVGKACPNVSARSLAKAFKVIPFRWRVERTLARPGL